MQNINFTIKSFTKIEDVQRPVKTFDNYPNKIIP